MFENTRKFIRESTPEEVRKELESYGVKFVPNTKEKKERDKKMFDDLIDFIENAPFEEVDKWVRDAGIEVVDNGESVETLILDKPTMKFIIKELEIKEKEHDELIETLIENGVSKENKVINNSQQRGCELRVMRNYFNNIMVHGGVLQFDKYGDWSFVKNEED